MWAELGLFEEVLKGGNTFWGTLAVKQAHYKTQFMGAMMNTSFGHGQKVSVLRET